jgi:hypothetical protein
MSLGIVRGFIGTMQPSDFSSACILPPVMARWECLLGAEDAPIHTKNVAWVALATLLHKYSVSDKHVAAKAVAVIDHLNRDVVLSDGFAHQSVAIRPS